MISNWYFAYQNIDSEDDQSISFHETFGNRSFEIKVMSIKEKKTFVVFGVHKPIVLVTCQFFLKEIKYKSIP